MNHKTLYLSVLIFLSIWACRRDDYYEGADVKLTFSEDTLRIDTVFTTLGSTTRWIKVYNTKDEPILVDVKIRNENHNFFRINADGLKGPSVSNIEINALDSMYIFVEVTIDPNQPLSISPFVVTDYIDVTANGKTFTAVVEAWGQNANYITPTSGKGKSYLYSCDFGQRVWDDPKPYVIYGILYIDSCTIELPAGTHLYVHGGIVRDSQSIYNDGLLVFLKDGKLRSLGTAEQPVVIQGDRLEKEYQDVKSQWVGILFWHESRANLMQHTVVKNSQIGIRVDSLASVKMNGCQISNTSGPAVIGRHATVIGENCLFYDNSSYALQLTYGGNYRFDYCTIGNYEGQKEALALTDFYCQDPVFCSTGIQINRLDASFTNCIFAGSDQDEIALATRSQNASDFNYSFDHCAFRVDELLDAKNFPNFFDQCTDCINLNSNDRIFLNQRKNDYRLDTMSVALGKAKSLTYITTDIINKARKAVPDLGCYEF